MGAFGRSLRKFIDEEIVGAKPPKAPVMKSSQIGGTGVGVNPGVAGNIMKNKQTANALMREAEAELNSQSKAAQKPRK